MPSSGPAGSDAKTIVFSHANSFPAGTYRLLFEAWHAAGYTVHAIDQYGHDPAYPVTDHWPRLRDQLIDFADKRIDGPAFLVGHSLGGFLSLLAAAKRPEIARGVVMLDSPLIGGLLSQAVRLHKATGMGERFAPSNVSRRRRQRWASREVAHTHFAGKASFAVWHPPVLQDYIEHGLADADDAEGGVRLSFAREVETRIYETIPHDPSSFLRRHPLRCPVAFIGGTRSAEVRQVGLTTTRRVVKDRISYVEGTHLFPFEQPAATAAEVLKWLAMLSA